MTSLQIEPIIQAAITAPSGDNCQPWSFVWDGHCLAIHHNEELGRHRLNWNNFASLISLGMVLELIQMAASEQGFKSQFEFRNLGSSSSSHWVDVLFSNHENMASDSLFNAAFLRATDRRRFKAVGIDHPVLQRILSDSKSSEVVKVSICNSLPQDFAEFLAVSETLVWKDKKAFRDLMRWLRLTRSQIAGHVDGLPWNNLGVTYLETRVLALLKAYPDVLQILRALGFVHQVKRKMRKVIRQTPIWIGFSLKAISSENLIELGRVVLRTWLRLNANDFGVQPMTSGSLSLAALSGGVISSDLPSEFLNLFKNGSSLFQKAFGLTAGDHPAWLFRVGMSNPLPPPQRTRRRPLETCLTDLTRKN